MGLLWSGVATSRRLGQKALMLDSTLVVWAKLARRSVKYVVTFVFTEIIWKVLRSRTLRESMDQHEATVDSVRHFSPMKSNKQNISFSSLGLYSKHMLCCQVKKGSSFTASIESEQQDFIILNDYNLCLRRDF